MMNSKALAKLKGFVAGTCVALTAASSSSAQTAPDNARHLKYQEKIAGQKAEAGKNSNFGTAFGVATAVFGDWLIVGAPGEDVKKNGVSVVSAGNVRLFHRDSSGNYTQVGRLPRRDTTCANPGDFGQQFGSAVKVVDGRLFVGLALCDLSGVIHVYDYDNAAGDAPSASQWKLSGSFKAPEPSQYEQFGTGRSAALFGVTPDRKYAIALGLDFTARLSTLYLYQDCSTAGAPEGCSEAGNPVYGFVSSLPLKSGEEGMPSEIGGLPTGLVPIRGREFLVPIIGIGPESSSMIAGFRIEENTEGAAQIVYQAQDGIPLAQKAAQCTGGTIGGMAYANRVLAVAYPCETIDSASGKAILGDGMVRLFSFSPFRGGRFDVIGTIKAREGIVGFGASDANVFSARRGTDSLSISPKGRFLAIGSALNGGNAALYRLTGSSAQPAEFISMAYPRPASASSCTQFGAPIIADDEGGVLISELSDNKVCPPPGGAKGPIYARGAIDRYSLEQGR